MGKPAPDTVLRLVEARDIAGFLRRDMTEIRLGISGRVPSGFSEPPDKLNLDLDDKPLKDIIGNLYYPDSPYEFSVIGIEILGEVYEQFLGKVIRLTAGHQAKVEEKPQGLVPTRALDGPSAPRKLSAMQTELRPVLTETR